MEANEVAIIIASVGGLIVTIGGAFWKWVNATEKNAEEARVNAQERATAEREMMTKMFGDSIKILSEATDKNTKAQERTANEAKERNGHLAELQLKSQEMIDKNRKCYEDGLKKILKDKK